MELVWIIGCTAWFSTALVHKNGPFDIFLILREWSFTVWGKKEERQLSPFVCTFCIGPYVLVLVLLINLFIPSIVQFFGILGIAAAVRGMSQEY